MPFPPITESMIRVKSTTESFQRGKEYYRAGAISNAAIQGNILSGECEGTSAPYYRVRVELDDAGIRSATCTCPYEFGGYCKHVVALLLVYVHAPKQFIFRASTEDLLAELSREDLLALLTKLLQRQPDLYDWVQSAIATPTPGAAKKSRRKKVDLDVYRRQVRNIFHSLDGMRRSEAYWHVGGLTESLREVQETALKFLASGDAETALAILLTLAEEVFAGYEYIDDSDGMMGDFVDNLGQPLAEAILSLELSVVEREKLGQQLKKLDKRFSDYGIESGMNLALQAAMYGWNDAPTSSHPEDEEEDYHDEEYDDEEFEDYQASYHEPYGNLVEAKLNVLERQGKTEEYLALCRKENRPLRYALKLCELGRTDEAIQFARKNFTTAEEARELAETLRQLKRVNESVAVAERGLSLAPPRAGLGAWLGPVEEARGRIQEAFEAWLATFAEQPSLETYQTLKRLAAPTWDKTRTQVMGVLKKSRDEMALAQIHLAEHEWDEAIKIADKREVWYQVTAMVADAVIAHRPEWVIRVSIRESDKLIAQTQSKYYAHSAEWLERAKQAYAQLGKKDEWRTYLERLKEQYKRRPALQEQLRRL